MYITISETAFTAASVSVCHTVLAFSFDVGRERSFPWLDLLGAFIAAVGFVLGMGASHVTFILGLRAGRDATKRRAWVWAFGSTVWLVRAGLLLAGTGSGMLYRDGLYGWALFQVGLAPVLIFGHVYFSLRALPRLERLGLQTNRDGSRRGEEGSGLHIAHAASLAVWWVELLLFVRQLLTLR
ncbi:MAG: hypothetical protein ACRD9R_04720 [Pyrinomonadaceae bacterium]